MGDREVVLWLEVSLAIKKIEFNYYLLFNQIYVKFLNISSVKEYLNFEVGCLMRLLCETLCVPDSSPCMFVLPEQW